MFDFVQEFFVRNISQDEASLPSGWKSSNSHHRVKSFHPFFDQVKSGEDKEVGQALEVLKKFNSRIQS